MEAKMKKALFTLMGLLAFTAAHAADLTPMPAKDAAATAPAEAKPSETKPAEAAAAPAETHGTVARAIFTSAVKDREPTDTLTNLTNDVTNISFFTELQGLQGQTVTHRWEHNDKVMAEVKFEVGAARWRVFSSKRLDPSWTGEWKVSVVDANGSTLSASTFTYAAGDKAAAPAASEPAAATSPAMPAEPATTK
jgi:hypothetical protein